MAQLVLTVVGADHAGLVRSLAACIAEHGGNWERSELAELAGTFAGIVLVSVPDEGAEALGAALAGLDETLRVTTHPGSSATPVSVPRRRFTVLGNDRPGIVRDVTTAVSAHALSIDRFRSRTVDAAMSGGTLFEATVDVRIPDAAASDALTAALEGLAGEIQVDVAIA
ncbi:glycine cleavage system protein R [Microbacterium sp.]|uniref:glycine cleavage system protein R n=1 Tax=Microbacterium sp. TaxID=51671 RepID=UPI003A8537A2